MSPALRERAGWLALLLGAGGWALGTGAGLVVVLLSMVGGRRGWALAGLARAAAVSLVVGAAGVHGGWNAVVVGVAALLLLFSGANAPTEQVRVPWVPALFGAALAAGWMLLPLALPAPDLVRPRPLSEALPVALALGAAALALPVVSGRDWHGPAWAGLLVAGAVPLARTGFLLAGLASSSPDDDPRWRAHADSARDLGLRALETKVVREAMTHAQGRDSPRTARTWWEEMTRPGDASRRDGDVLRLAAWSLDRTGAPGSDVDELLQESARRTSDVAPWVAWPGAERGAAVAQRAQVRLGDTAKVDAPPRGDAMECWAGTWCLLSVELPPLARSEVPGEIRLRWRLVAPAAGDVVANILLDWRGTEATVPLTSAGISPGHEWTSVLPVNMAQAGDKAQDCWLRLYPVDGGRALPLDKRPGRGLFIGQLRPPATP